VKRPEREIIRWGKLLFERRLISGWGGNLSCRVGKEEFLITSQHAPLGFLTVKDLVRINGEGRAKRKNQRASSETPMHLAVYKGTEARAIVHAHPPMVLAFSLTQENFVPLSFEEKYTIGEVPIIAQDTPTVTQPARLVEELKYRPVAIIKGHGSVAIGKDLQEAFLLTDLLEEAVRCQFFRNPTSDGHGTGGKTVETQITADKGTIATERSHRLFSREHFEALVKSANDDSRFRNDGKETCLTTSLTLHLEETDVYWTVDFVSGEIAHLSQKADGEFVISGKKQWWEAVFTNRIDPFFATQQGKLKLKRGEMARLSQWYKPFQRAFTLWQTIPIH
jgi:L-fuculose-phosphate aldolase